MSIRLHLSIYLARLHRAYRVWKDYPHEDSISVLKAGDPTSDFPENWTVSSIALFLHDAILRDIHLYRASDTYDVQDRRRRVWRSAVAIRNMMEDHPDKLPQYDFSWKTCPKGAKTTQLALKLAIQKLQQGRTLFREDLYDLVGKSALNQDGTWDVLASVKQILGK